MEIAIVDDVARDRLHLEELIYTWNHREQEPLTPSFFESGEAFLTAHSPGRFSIVLLDLFMGGISGMETARELRRRGDRCQIVFTTTSDAYALQGYEVDAANYLLKPVEGQALNQALHHCFTRIGEVKASITIVANRVPTSIPLDRIVWISTQRNALLFHTDGGTIKSYMTFERLLEMLEGNRQFLLCCKGCLVNMDRVLSVEGDDFIMDDKEHVPIRKRGASQIKRDYLEYFFSRGQS